jgi:hypothetical protein
MKANRHLLQCRSLLFCNAQANAKLRIANILECMAAASHPLGAWQWTEDCMHDTYEGAPADGSARLDGECKSHVVRGGSWNHDPGLLGVARRSRSITDDRTAFFGLRAARTLAP